LSTGETFNRTIEELKFEGITVVDEDGVAFNRTIEELKFSW